MIKSTQQATAIQKRRFDAGKRGVSKAIRRFANKTGRSLLNRLPINWTRPAPKDGL